MEFSSNAIFAGYRRFSKEDREYRVCTLLIEGLGSFDFFVSPALDKQLNGLSFGSLYSFTFRVTRYNNHLQINLAGVV